MPKRKKQDSGSSSAAAAAASVDKTEAINTTGNPIDVDDVQNWIKIAKKERHNEVCKLSRKKIKGKNEEREKELDVTKKQLNETREENKKVMAQLESKSRDLENAYQEIKKVREEKAAEVQCMRLMINQLIGNGQNYSVDKLIELITQLPVRVGEGSNYHNLSPYAAVDPFLQDPNNNFSTHNPTTGFAAFAPGTSSVANPNLIVGLNGVTVNDCIDYGFPTASAAGFSANHDFTVFDAPNNPANTGFPPAAAGGFSANHGFTVQAPNNPVDTGFLVE